MKKNKFIYVGFLLFIYECIFIYIILHQLKRIGAFGCFDDCFNFGAGYFLLQGKQLYSQIFFNHQPFMAYISAAIQYISHPQTLFELVKYHRIAAMLSANIFGGLLIIRFGLPLFLSLVIFETTKFYIFGDRFLAEGIIVYPMIYMMVFILRILKKQTTYAWEYIVSAACSWFIFWMREPFMPWAVSAFAAIISLSYLQRHNRRSLAIALCVFLLLHCGSIFSLPLRDYYFNVIHTNLFYEVPTEPLTLLKIAKISFYPFFLLLQSNSHIFIRILKTISVVYILVSLYQFLHKKTMVIVFTVVFFLAVANVRVVPVGKVFFDAFHMIPWYGMTVVVTVFGMYDIFINNKSRLLALVGSGVLLWIAILLLSPSSYLKEKINTEEEFTTNYANYFAKGQVVKLLAKPGDTMFVEMWEDPIYFVAGVPSAYQYSWYTSIMPFITKYEVAREEMFKLHPPTFYVGACREGEVDSFALTKEDKEKYTQLINSGKPSCIYMMKSFIPMVSDKQREQIFSFGFLLPDK